MINGLVYANKDILPARNLGNERKMRATSNPDLIFFFFFFFLITWQSIRSKVRTTEQKFPIKSHQDNTNTDVHKNYLQQKTIYNRNILFQWTLHNWNDNSYVQVLWLVEANLKLKVGTAWQKCTFKKTRVRYEECEIQSKRCLSEN